MLPIFFLLIMLLSSPALATTYYVSPSGVDTNCANYIDIGQPAATPDVAAVRLSAGDTLIMRGGVYTSRFNDTIPSGTSWNTPVTVKAHTGETPIIRPTTVNAINISGSNSSYIVIDGITLDGVNSTSDGLHIGEGAHHVKFQNGVIDGFVQSQGVSCFAADATPSMDMSCWIADSTISDNGNTSFKHGLYMTGANNIVERCLIHGNYGWGIQAFNSFGGVNTNTYRYNRIRNNGTDGGGILLSRGTGNTAYGNVVYDNTVWGGIRLASTCVSCTVYNNTLHGNTSYGIRNEASAATIRNNIVYDNTINISNTGTMTSNTNLCNTTDSGVGCVAGTPAFVDAANKNFQLLTSSTAINAGADVGLSFNGAAPDQGAHETLPFSSGSVEDQTPTIATVCFQNNVHPAMLPTSGCTGFTCRVNTVSRTINSCARNTGNTNCMDLTLASAVAGGQDLDCGYALTGNVSDSGGQAATEPFAFTDQDLTNNIAQGPPPPGVGLRTGTTLRTGVVIR